MGVPTDQVYVVAREVLDALVASWPVDATALPDRQYVHSGNAIWDCDQLVVSVEGTFPHTGNVNSEEATAHPAAAGFGMRAVRLAIWLVRCIDVGVVNEASGDVTPPTQAQADADAAVILSDATALVNVLIGVAGDLASCHGVSFEGWQAMGPEGGLSGGVLRVRVSLY
jgi:hypothetical protein